jgi:hypothetical protein
LLNAAHWHAFLILCKEAGKVMKGVILLGVLLMSLNLFGNSSDTTVTSFEIHLKRKSDNPLGFNTCSIDRQYIYNLVVEKLQKKIKIENLKSLHQPFVLMKFVDVCGKDNHKSQISETDKKSLSNMKYNYFIKICGSLDIDRPMNQYSAATFKLKVYVFDAAGNLITKSKSRSRENLAVVKQTNDSEGYPLNENEFFDLVNEAADSIEISI